MTLVECSSIHGNTTLFEHDPDCGVFYNVLYMPVTGHNPTQGRSFGLYQPDGSLIRAAGRFRGPDGALAGPLLYCGHDRSTLAPALDGPGFFYLGAFTSHYGHFLIDTLCRLWALVAWRGDRKILYHGFETPAEMFKISFAAEIFSACGLTEADFVKFDEPALLGQVVVPSPAIEELNYVHRGLATCFQRIGDLICPAPPRETQDAPVYLTKAMVTSGVSHYVNERDFVTRLERDGIQIVAPETLPLREQVQLFRSRRIVTGLIGSAFHTALFAPSRDVLILNYEPVVWSNQILIDNARGGRSTFVCEAGGSRNEGPDGRFDNNFRMSDPIGLAEQFLRRIDGLNRAARPAPVTGRSAAPLRASCAVVLVVKDEAHDIAAWLAWYHVLGFDACIVYDDDSTDGTWDILRTASSVQDIRLSRTVGEKLGPYEHRQDECYRRALRDYGEEFDWLAFFDADEFLHLIQDSDVKRFWRGSRRPTRLRSTGAITAAAFTS